MSAPQIMIVEDEVVVAMELRETLQRLGYRVAGIIADGEDAVRKAAELSPDLILMDIHLAGKVDGIEAVRRISTRHQVPVVYLTAHSDEMTLHRAKHSTPSGYLLKPFSAAELRATIEVALYRHEREQSDRQCAALFSQVIEFNGGAAVATDDTGTIRHMNALAEVLTGWDRTEAIGRPLGEVYVLRGACAGDLLKLGPAAIGPTPQREFILVRKDGGEIIVQAETLTLTSPSGRGTVSVYCFREKARRTKMQQDWFSHSVNLRLASRMAAIEGNYIDAEYFLKRALEIIEEELGANHPKVASAVEDLANVLRLVGKNAEADLLDRRWSRIHSNN